MDGEEDNVVTTFMNLFNPVHAFAILQMEIILLMMRIYNNNNKNIQNSFYLEANYERNFIKRRIMFPKFGKSLPSSLIFG